MKSFYPTGCAVKNRRRTLLRATLSLSLLSGPTMSWGYLTQINQIEHNDNLKVFRVGSNYRVEYTVPSWCQERFRSLMENCALDPYTQWPAYIKRAAEALQASLPEDLISLIRSMRSINEPACIQIQGMPIDEIIPPTPRNGARPTDKGFISEATLMGVCGLLEAEPDYDEREKDGTYINQIIPVDSDKNKAEASSLGSEIEFFVHTENVYNQPPLKFFALLGLRGDPKVCTGVIFLDDILQEVCGNPPPGMSFTEFMEEIQKPQFYMQSGPSFGENSRARIVAPILMRNAKGERVYRFNANPDRVIGMNDTAQRIVDHLTSLLTDTEVKSRITTKINIQAGSMLLFNNWEVMHGRDAFKIDKENWRWLQRVYMLVRD